MRGCVGLDGKPGSVPKALGGDGAPFSRGSYGAAPETLRITERRDRNVACFEILALLTVCGLADFDRTGQTPPFVRGFYDPHSPVREGEGACGSRSISGRVREAGGGT
jgi:hypothetical protein